MRASAQQQESCVSILSALPSPLEAKPPDSRQFHDCVVPPPPQFFFLRIVGLRGHGGEWETGYCISFADGLFSFSGDSWIGLTSLITASLLIVCQLVGRSSRQRRFDVKITGQIMTARPHDYSQLEQS